MGSPGALYPVPWWRGKLRVNNDAKIAFIAKWSSWFYEHTESFEEPVEPGITPIGSDLAYLFTAVAKSDSMMIEKEEEDRWSILQLLRQENVPENDPIWTFIDVRET